MRTREQGRLHRPPPAVSSEADVQRTTSCYVLRLYDSIIIIGPVRSTVQYWQQACRACARTCVRGPHTPPLAWLAR